VGLTDESLIGTRIRLGRGLADSGADAGGGTDLPAKN